MNKEDIKYKLLNFVIFIVIIILLITSIFNMHLLFLEKDNYDKCFKGQTPPIYEKDCDYNQEIIDNCYYNNGNIIYLPNCQVKCDYCYAEQSAINDSINLKKAWFRIILSLILLLLFAYLNMKDKLIQYALITGSIISLVASTIFSINIMNQRIYPLMTLLVLVIILVLYKTVFNKRI